MISIIVFIFGLAVGSFLNVLIWRLHTGESILNGRSYCPKCKHVLGAKDLVPVFSFLFQKGKCRYCGKLIDWQYPLVELATAILFVAAFLQISDFRFQILELLKNWFVISVMVVVFVYDLKYTLILDKVIYPAAVVALLASPLIDGQGVRRGIATALVAAAIGGGFFLLQYALSKGKWIGGGDVKMGFLMGLILGIKGLLVALFFSYVLGALAGSILVAASKKTMKSAIPFGTFLAVGTLIAMFWGEEILRWYLK
jgi:prepilin signal peptidase PulO-like enzyme (type II secretory pathway)